MTPACIAATGAEALGFHPKKPLHHTKPTDRPLPQNETGTSKTQFGSRHCQSTANVWIPCGPFLSTHMAKE
jgi:hypothetical protein